MSHIFKFIMLRTIDTALCSQAVELLMVESDHGEQPGGPPSPAEKPLADWEFSEQ